MAITGAYLGLGLISTFVPLVGALLSWVPFTIGMVRNIKVKITDPNLLRRVITAWQSIKEILKREMLRADILEIGAEYDIGLKLGFSKSYIRDRTNQINRGEIQSKKVYDLIFTRLYEMYYEFLSESWQRIEDKFLDFYHNAFPLDSKLPPYKKRTPPRVDLYNSIKAIIVQEIKKISGKDKIQAYQKDISKILFNDFDYIRHNFLRSKGKRLEITTLYNMLYYIRNSRFKELENILKINRISKVGGKYSFDENILLKTIKRKLTRSVRKFIFSNPYTVNYINNEYGADFFKEKFDFTIDALFLLSDRYSTEIKDGRKSCLTLKYVRKKIFRIETYGEMTKNYDYGFQTVRAIQSHMKRLLDSKAYNKFLETSTR